MTVGRLDVYLRENGYKLAGRVYLLLGFVFLLLPIAFLILFSFQKNRAYPVISHIHHM